MKYMQFRSSVLVNFVTSVLAAGLLLVTPLALSAQVCTGNTFVDRSLTGLEVSAGEWHGVPMRTIGFTFVSEWTPFSFLELERTMAFEFDYGRFAGDVTDQMAIRFNTDYAIMIPLPRSHVPESFGLCVTPGLTVGVYSLTNATEDVSMSYLGMPIAVNAGYAIDLGSFVLTPYLGPGVNFFAALGTANTESGDYQVLGGGGTDFFGEAGATARFDVFMVGTSLRLGDIEFGESPRITLQAGVNF